MPALVDIAVPRLAAALSLAGFVLIAAGTPAVAVPVPLTPAPTAGPIIPAQQARQARVLEAETKARSLAKHATADAGQTANMSLYDVVHYDLDLNLDPATTTLSGTVNVTAEVLGDPLTQVDLHLRANMLVTSATVAGSPAAFVRAADVMTVTLDRIYLPGETVTVGVAYSGNPAGSSFGWDSYEGEPMIWTLSEPYGAREWWPCKDVNSDKADIVDLRVTVPAGLIVASNGLLLSEIDHGGTRTFHWQESYPIATYLVSLAIHPYAVFSDWYQHGAAETMELQFYVVPQLLSEAQSAFAVTVAQIEAFAAGFGEYPFVEEKYGHAQFPWGGGMEHQTLTSLGYFALSEGIIAHELAHQWWGDLVTCADFQHIWLNEGFATWSEAYWREQNEGMAAYHEEMAAARYFGGGTIIVENPDNFAQIFNYNLSYLKASWVVHMLRRVLGEADFFAALRAYATTYAYGSATTEQFQAVCEDISSLDLQAFFQQWIYGEYFPWYEFSWYSFDPGEETRVQLRIAQTQTNTGLFTMPLDVEVITSEGSSLFTVQNSQLEQYYSFSVSGTVQDVVLDPQEWVLRGITESEVAVPAPFPTGPSLLPNQPNPFNPRTAIRFILATPGLVTLQIYDAAGRQVRELLSEERPAGRHEVVWDGRDGSGRALPSGTYFSRLRAGASDQTRKMMLIK